MFILYIIAFILLLQSIIAVCLIRKIRKAKDIWMVSLILQKYIHDSSINIVKWATFYVVLLLTQRRIFGLGMQYQRKEKYPNLLFATTLFQSNRTPFHIKNMKNQVAFFYDRFLFEKIKERTSMLLSGDIEYSQYRHEVAGYLLKLEHYDLLPQILKELQKPVNLFRKTNDDQDLEFDFFIYAAKMGVLSKFISSFGSSVGVILGGEDNVLKELQKALCE